MGHVTHMNGIHIGHFAVRYRSTYLYTRHTYEWAMSHIRMGHVTHMNGTHIGRFAVRYRSTYMYTRHTYEWAVSHT